MIKISIFVAGAKSLKEQRLLLKALANDLNDEYNNKKNLECAIVVKTYENFGDRQDEYNDFIMNEADLVIFVLEDRIGQLTEEEYIVASNSYLKKGKPNVLVFLKTFKERTADITRIEGLLNGTLSTFYVDYNNNEELVDKARERLRNFIRNHVKSQQRNLRTRLRNNKRTISAVLCTVLVSTLVVFGCCLNYFNTHYPKQLILLAGGGSMKNFLFNKFKELHSDPTLIYANLPSRISWFMLGEDVRDKYGIKEQDKNRYYTVSVSASKINASLIQNFDESKGKIVGYKFANADTLVVWAEKRNVTNFIDTMSHAITTKQLVDLMRQKGKVRTYTTEQNSGTYKSYSDVLGENLQFNDTLQYSETTTVSGPENGMYILLGSSYYTKNAVNSSSPSADLVPLVLIDDGKPLLKDMFVYFNGYTMGSDNLWIPQVTSDFLSKILPKEIYDNYLKNNVLTVKPNVKVVYIPDDLSK